MTTPDCRDLLGDLSGYLDGETAPDLCREIERHLADCPHCRIVVDSLGKTISLYRLLPAENVPGDVQARLLHVLHLDEQ